ncbi:unnamed protein product [Rotaria sp. Silwood1]|nr:unnamed protein product [Rotaria sp. Silwood1]
MDPSAFSNEFIGYEPFNLISNYLSKGKYNKKTNLKFLENDQNELDKKSFLLFIENLSLFSCYYEILPDQLTEIYLLTYYLIFFYITILILNEDSRLNKLMKTFGDQCNYHVTNNDLAWNEFIKKGRVFIEIGLFKSNRVRTCPGDWSSSEFVRAKQHH